MVIVDVIQRNNLMLIKIQSGNNGIYPYLNVSVENAEDNFNTEMFIKIRELIEKYNKEQIERA